MVMLVVMIVMVIYDESSDDDNNDSFRRNCTLSQHDITSREYTSTILSYMLM